MITFFASAETARARMAICLACPLYNRFLGQCRECGCFIMLKTRLQREACPKDKW